MKKIVIIILLCLFGLTSTGCFSQDKTIRVCASELPHADVLNNCVREILKLKGYKLEVSVLDWTLQNDGVANKDYDANYFQHIPYLETYSGETSLFATCKVHYEPLGIYYGKEKKDLLEGKSFEICNDESNAVRALKLLQEKGVLKEAPITSDGKLAFTGSTWISDNDIKITLISEELLVSSINDYDFALLPCNTAYTGNISSSRLVDKEDNQTLILENANVIAARQNDYLEDSVYKKKIDVLTEAMLSKEVREYIQKKYEGKITCDEKTQIDLRK
ncbi:MAG: MetQ/NlpA family ABC transporter substrate-binding protein [Coprobacillus sp.]|nr:MetQ/NlpA family ABC transporter substrate-binding protein [Coprobacillus sp.]